MKKLLSGFWGFPFSPLKNFHFLSTLHHHPPPPQQRRPTTVDYPETQNRNLLVAARIFKFRCKVAMSCSKTKTKRNTEKLKKNLLREKTICFYFNWKQFRLVFIMIRICFASPFSACRRLESRAKSSCLCVFSCLPRTLDNFFLSFSFCFVLIPLLFR